MRDKDKRKEACWELDARLDEYVDGTLPLDERGALESHLEGCASCRETVQGLRGLQAEAAELPAELAPPRDLWPEIRETLATAPAARAATGGWRPAQGGWRRWATLAAAAVLLVVASVSLTLLFTGGSTGESAPTRAAVEPPPEELILPGLQVVEQEYARATAELQDLLEESRDRLAPETLQVVEKNLRIIDRAIEETRAALELDPGNSRLGRFLTAMYLQRVEVMRRAARVSVHG